MRRSPGTWYDVAAFLFLALTAIAALIPVRAQAPGGFAHFYNSLRGMHVAGYKGFFDCPNDGAGIGWGHWFRGGADTRDPNSIAFDIWPDTSELGPDELCPTGFNLPSGAPAYLFSDHNPKTVARQFLWMRQYGLDGGAMQRFTSMWPAPRSGRISTRFCATRVPRPRRTGAVSLSCTIFLG